MIRALVFDFDGLILDTETPLIDAYGEIHRSRNMPFDRAKFMRQVGTASGQAFDPWKAFGAGAPRADLEAEMHRICFELLEHQPILPGVVELIAEARQHGLQLAIASNSTREHVIGHLKRLNLFDKFEFFACHEDVEQDKPAPDLYLIVMENFKMHGEEILALEDSATGVAAARAAGLWCAAVPNESTREHNFSEAHLLIESLAGQTLGSLFTGLRMSAHGGKP